MVRALDVEGSRRDASSKDDDVMPCLFECGGVDARREAQIDARVGELVGKVA